MNISTHLHPSFTNFDLLPDSAHVRVPIVKALLGVSSATVWRMVKSKQLKTYKLTPRTTTFKVGEIRDLISAGEYNGTKS